MAAPQPPLPDPSDPLTGAFWAGLRDRRLMVQRCTACGAARYPSAPLCPDCLSTGTEWVEIPPTGKLWSYAVYHRDLSGAFASDIPYTIGVVEVACQLHILARVDTSFGTPTVGAGVRADFHDVADGVTLLRWRLADGGAA